ncbi:MAG: hypothetical protein JG718_14110 [Candidatus Thiothrix moscowensis]|nr:hypothetical protein [Candidatus Thiothrix moscowensis]
MFRKNLGAGVVGLALLLGGCDNSSGDKPPASVQQNANSRYLISSTAAGAVQLGMNLNEVLIALPNATSSNEQDGEGITWAAITVHGEIIMRLMLDDADHTVNLIRVFSPEYKTEQGVHVGENLQSVADKLGGLTEIQATEIESREFATFKNSPQNVEFQVVGRDGSAGVYANSGTSTSIASPSATIHSVWIMED